MPHALYVCLQDEDKIVAFAIDPDSGRLTPNTEAAVSGGPSVLAISPDRRVLYLGQRTNPAILSFRIDQNTGAFSPQGTVSTEHAPTFLATDRTGRYLLSAYYQGGYAAVHPLATDGTVGASAVDRKDTANGAHAIQTDRSNRFAFVPHIARLNDNVLEPAARQSRSECDLSVLVRRANRPTHAQFTVAGGTSGAPWTPPPVFPSEP